MKWIRIGVVATSVLAVLAPVTMGTASAAPVSRSAHSAAATVTVTAAPRVPVLTWKACDGGFQCATARVPLDYRHPDGAKISIAVVRHLATDPARRLGSLFVNGGGPSVQIPGFLASYPQLPAVLRQRFDIISFDPRGLGESTAVRCFPTATAEQKFLSALPAFPVGAKQDAMWERTYARFDARCAKTGTPLLDHDSSADVARDMDLLRAAVGDPVLNYVGLSYATGLGAIYANLFPARVGRMILDANFDPVAWTAPDGNLSVSLRLGADEAGAASVTDFLDLCGKTTTAACAFSAGTPAATRVKWHTLLRRLRVHPVTVGNPPQTFTYADAAIGVVPIGLVAAWQQGAVLMQQLWVASAHSTAPAGASHAPRASRAAAAPAAPTAYTGLEQALAVECSDSPNPRKVSVYASDVKLAQARAGGYGLGYLWSDEPCAQWPGNHARDRYTGPWNRRTAHTILLLGNTHDAILPYQNDQAMEHDLARARLLTVRGYGHTEQLNPSTCAMNYELRYLQTGALPKAGTVCKQNATPFPAP